MEKEKNLNKNKVFIRNTFYDKHIFIFKQINYTSHTTSQNFHYENCIILNCFLYYI